MCEVIFFTIVLTVIFVGYLISKIPGRDTTMPKKGKVVDRMKFDWCAGKWRNFPERKDE